MINIITSYQIRWQFSYLCSLGDKTSVQIWRQLLSEVTTQCNLLLKRLFVDAGVCCNVGFRH